MKLGALRAPVARSAKCRVRTVPLAHGLELKSAGQASTPRCLRFGLRPTGATEGAYRYGTAGSIATPRLACRYSKSFTASRYCLIAFR